MRLRVLAQIGTAWTFGIVSEFSAPPIEFNTPLPLDFIFVTFPSLSTVTGHRSSLAQLFISALIRERQIDDNRDDDLLLTTGCKTVSGTYDALPTIDVKLYFQPLKVGIFLQRCK